MRKLCNNKSNELVVLCFKKVVNILMSYIICVRRPISREASYSDRTRPAILKRLGVKSGPRVLLKEIL